MCSIDDGLLYQAHPGEFPIIAYYPNGVPIYQDIYSPAALAPLIERGLLVPAAKNPFSIIAYQHNGTPIYQGIDENGHKWPDTCPAEECSKVASRSAKPKRRRKKGYVTQRALRERFEAGDPQVGVLLENSLENSISMFFTQAVLQKKCQNHLIHSQYLHLHGKITCSQPLP